MTSVHLVEANSGSNSFVAFASLDQAAIDALPEAVYLCAGDGRMVRFNQKAAELWGRTPKSEDPEERFCGSLRLYRTDGALLPHDQCPMAVALQTGECFHNQEVIIEQPSGQRRTVLANIATLKDKNGRVYGGINCFKDITDRKRVEEQQRVLLAELDHRVKNTLATVSAVVSHTLNASGSMADFATALDGRVQSMARAHELLSANRWQGISVAELVQRELAPYAMRGNTEIDGPEVILNSGAGQVMAMVLHELSTNAAKYGALSTQNGRVSIRWRLRPNGHTRSHLVLEWREFGGPSVVPPRNSGFGTSTIRDIIPYELGGTADLTFAPDGVQCRLELPADWFSKDGSPVSEAVARAFPTNRTRLNLLASAHPDTRASEKR